MVEPSLSGKLEQEVGLEGSTIQGMSLVWDVLSLLCLMNIQTEKPNGQTDTPIRRS